MSTNNYSTSMKAIHWGTLLLVIAAFLSIEFREFFEKGTENRELFKFVHFQIGGLLLLLTIARLVIRKVKEVPDMVSMPKWQTAVAHGVHLALYACLIAMPILGVLTLVFAGKDTTVLGFEMQGWVAANKDFAHDLEEIHETIGEAFMWIILLHAAGALVHHFVQKDDTLVKMTFSRR